MHFCCLYFVFYPKCYHQEQCQRAFFIIYSRNFRAVSLYSMFSSSLYACKIDVCLLERLSFPRLYSWCLCQMLVTCIYMYICFLVCSIGLRVYFHANHIVWLAYLSTSIETGKCDTSGTVFSLLQQLLWVHARFRKGAFCSISVKNDTGILIGIILNLYIFK